MICPYTKKYNWFMKIFLRKKTTDIECSWKCFYFNHVREDLDYCQYPNTIKHKVPVGFEDN